MKKFGDIKSKVLVKLTESYSLENKDEVKNILKSIKGQNDFKEMYLFYEEIENKYFDDKETAKLYVEEVVKILKEKSKNLKSFCESLDQKLGDVVVVENEIYSVLDQLSEEENLNNIDKKVIAKKKLVDYLTSKKNTEPTTEMKYIQNENLLHAVLANNSNVVYDKSLNEEQKTTLKNLLSMSQDELNVKTVELKESLYTQIDSILKESNDDELKIKLLKVKDEIKHKDPSRFNYYQLTELKNGLI